MNINDAFHYKVHPFASNEGLGNVCEGQVQSPTVIRGSGWVLLHESPYNLKKGGKKVQLSKPKAV